ncbi:MAG: hypothetical protein ACRD2R_05565 [Terriglobales bacterium]
MWQTIRGYVLWEYPRGSVHYDVMVTLILAFIFLAPRWINFKDKPVERNPHPTVVVVLPDGEGGFVYQVAAAAVTATDEEAIEAELRRVIEPIAGEITIVRREPVLDRKGQLMAYKVWVRRF